MGRKGFPSEVFNAETARKKNHLEPIKGSGFVFSASNLSISPPFGRSTNSVRTTWPFIKHVRGKFSKYRALPGALTHRRTLGRTGSLAGWLPAASRAYFLVQTKESGLLLASSGPACCLHHRSLRPAQAWCQKPQNISWEEGMKTRVTGFVPY